MAWPKLAGAERTSDKEVEIPRDPTAFFKPLKEFRQIHALKVSGWGPPESGKSYFGDTFPEPVYVIDTELSAKKVAYQHFSDRDIRIFEVKIVDPATDEPRPLECLNETEQAIRSLATLKSGTVVIDTITDYWSWMSAYVASQAKKFYKTTGDVMRTEWSIANERYRYFIMRLLAMEDVNVVLLAQAKRVFDDKGKELPTRAPKWMFATPHMTDLEIKFWKLELEGTVQYKATIHKCRWNRAWNKTVEDLTYPDLLKILRDELKVKVLQEVQ